MGIIARAVLENTDSSQGSQLALRKRQFIYGDLNHITHRSSLDSFNKDLQYRPTDR